MNYVKTNMEKTGCSEPELRNKAARYCACAERYEQEVRDKLRTWGAGESEASRIVDYLQANNYLDARRYCEAYAHDKVCYQGWGRRKIEVMLHAKHLPDNDIEYALASIDSKEYDRQLQRLLDQKRGQERQKTIRFLLSRGFTMEEISEKIFA